MVGRSRVSRSSIHSDETMTPVVAADHWLEGGTPPELAFDLRRTVAGCNLDPVFNAKPFDALKFTEVIANKCQTLTARMTSNHHVMKPNRVAGALEICTNLAVMGRGSFAKREHVQACCKLVDDREIFNRPCRLLCTIDNLGKSDGGDAKLIRKPIEAL